jgi:hypothetical protein
MAALGKYRTQDAWAGLYAALTTLATDGICGIWANIARIENSERPNHLRRMHGFAGPSGCVRHELARIRETVSLW